MKKGVILTLGIIVLFTVAWVVVEKFEGKEPIVEVKLPSIYLKKSYEMELMISDSGAGLRNINVSILQQGNEKVLLKKDYPSQAPFTLFSTTGQMRETFNIPVESWKYGMSDGEAIIRVAVTDFSWRRWNKGNLTYIEKSVIIDTKPPKLKILTKRHNVERGGSGLIIYRIFEEDVQTGIRVGNNFFPGYPGMFPDKNIIAAFFALTHLQGPGTQLAVIAVDVAGNETKKGFYHYIRDKKFKTDTINISDNFLNRKIEDFDVGEKTGAFIGNENPLLNKFLYINKELRKENNINVLKPAEESENKMMWEGRFIRLPGSARRSSFADRRTYKYKGKEIGKAYHLGIDLASTSSAEIPAANSGRVILAEFVGIFGNTVLIDHGFGLTSLYSHLSSFSVQKGDMVKRGDIIGNTGMTGLAGGDHLHYSMGVGHVFVNPVEWWDKSWIKNNITSKIQYIKDQVN